MTPPPEHPRTYRARWLGPKTTMPHGTPGTAKRSPIGEWYFYPDDNPDVYLCWRDDLELKERAPEDEPLG